MVHCGDGNNRCRVLVHAFWPAEPATGGTWSVGPRVIRDWETNSIPCNPECARCRNLLSHAEICPGTDIRLCNADFASPFGRAPGLHGYASIDFDIRAGVLGDWMCPVIYRSRVLSRLCNRFRSTRSGFLCKTRLRRHCRERDSGQDTVLNLQHENTEAKIRIFSMGRD